MPCVKTCFSFDDPRDYDLFCITRPRLPFGRQGLGWDRRAKILLGGVHFGWICTFKRIYIFLTFSGSEFPLLNKRDGGLREFAIYLFFRSRKLQPAVFFALKERSSLAAGKSERDHRLKVSDGSPLLRSSCLELLIGVERLDDFTFPSFKGTSWSSLPLLAGLVNFRLRHFRIGTP